MIEVPRGALQAGDKLAKDAEFFSFGTNDLTQLTLGFSRDDAGQFLPYYYEKKIYEFDPFQTIDVKRALANSSRSRLNAAVPPVRTF
jgi:pyruvate,orthophosphate dikinase